MSWVGQLVEGFDVSGQPCDGLDNHSCGSTGSTKLYVDGHTFQLCAECAWRLTEQYHDGGSIAPWEAVDEPFGPGLGQEPA